MRERWKEQRMLSAAAEIPLTASTFASGEKPREAGNELDQVIRNAQAGDPTAFDRLMIHYQRQVITTAWRMLGDEYDARDAAQEIFIRVYRHLKKYKREYDFSHWLYRITVNVCRDFARKRARRTYLTPALGSLDPGAIEAVAGPGDTESAAILAEERSIIAQAIASLSEKERAAIVLRDLEGLPSYEVARILGTSPETVRSRIAAARTKIRLFRERRANRGNRG
jgi:RNA polymerase sigma-70 factor (ECF subfamily)